MDRKHPRSMSATAEQSQPTPDQSVTTTTLLRQNLLRTFLSALAVLISIPLSVGFIGLLLFGGVVHRLVQAHFESAFSAKARGSFLAPLLIVGLALGAVLVCGGWIGLVDVTRYEQFPTSSSRVVLALVTLPLPYAVCAWVLAPVVYLIVLLVDIDAPKSLRHLVPLALRVASEVPILHRVFAVLASGAVLIGPAIVTVILAEGMHDKVGASVVVGILTVPIFIPVASALLVSSYSKVRHDLDSYKGHLPNFPAGLAVLTLVTLLTSAVAVEAGLNQPRNILLLAMAWLAIVAALFSFLSAHRIRCLDPMRDGAAPGKRALEGVLLRSHGKNVFVAGNLRFPIPADTLGDEQSGSTMTLVGDFAATTHALFRDQAEQEWPRNAKLHSKSLDALIRGRVRTATVVAYLALGAAGAVSIEMLTNVY